MSEMIDRIGFALNVIDYESIGFAPPYWGNLDEMPMDVIPIPAAQQEGYRARARAAIEAMREPTEDMTAAGAEAFDGHAIQLEIEPVWQAMIDAALK